MKINKENLKKSARKTSYIVCGIFLGALGARLLFHDFGFSIMGAVVCIAAVVIYFLSNYFNYKE